MAIVTPDQCLSRLIDEPLLSDILQGTKLRLPLSDWWLSLLRGRHGLFGRVVQRDIEIAITQWSVAVEHLGGELLFVLSQVREGR